MHVDLRDIHSPAADGMTVLARPAHLAAVDVGVAVGALVADIGEYHLGVAVRTGDALVQPAQGKFGLIVVELGHRADRLPSVDRMAILTRDVQITVRASRVIRRLRRSSARNGCRQQ